jgi:hypothetical protein
MNWLNENGAVSKVKQPFFYLNYAYKSNEKEWFF